MSQDIRIEDWQWERLMEVLGAIDQNTQRAEPVRVQHPII